MSALAPSDKLSRYLGERAEREEWGLLACIAREGAWLMADLQVAGVSQESFLDTRAGFVWDCLSAHITAGDPLSESAITSTLDERLSVARKRNATAPDFKPPYLSLKGETVADLLFHEPSYRIDSNTALFTGKRIVAGYQFRRTERELRKLLGESATWTGTHDAFVEEVQRRVLALPTLADTGKGVKNMGEHLKPALDRMYAEYHEPELGGLKTGFPRLDTLTNGMEPDDLVIVGAGSGVGKTVFALNVAAHVAQRGKKVLIFSLEMGINRLIRRLVHMESRLDTSVYRQHRMTDEDWGKISRASQTLCAQNIDVVDDFSITLPRLYATAKQASATHGVDLVVVDYAQILQTGETRKDGNREQEVKAIADGMKRLAGDLQCPVMLLTQLNDDGKVRESRTIRHNASHMWVLSVSACQDGLGEEGERGLTKRYEIEVDKGRDSATGAKVRMLFFPEQTRLEEETDMEESTNGRF